MQTILECLFDGRLPELVMFDLDGTLVDSVPDLTFAIQSMLLELSLGSADEQQVRGWVGNGAQKLVKRALNNAGVDDAEQVEAGLVLIKKHYQQHCSVDTRLYEGVTACLEAFHARGINMTVVTNKPREFVPAILNSLEIAHFFSQVIGGDDLAQRKPSPLPLLHCIERAGCQKTRALMVGDSKNDIQAARAAGIPVVAVNYGYNHGRPIDLEAPDYVLSSLTELL